MFFILQCSPLIALNLVPIGIDHVISKTCYKVTILQRKHKKVTMVIFPMIPLHPNPCYNEVCYKGTALY